MSTQHNTTEPRLNIMPPPICSAWQLTIARWAEWDGSREPFQPLLDFVEPIVRRRLSSLARMSLWVAHQCAADAGNVRMVYASRHGELQRTTGMLEALADNEALSPTAFSMSVLNASLGLYSITRGNTAPATAISAGEDTFACALLEAQMQLDSDPDGAVLLVYADEAVPPPYLPADAPQPAAHALALLLRKDASQRVLCQAVAANGSEAAELQSRAFATTLREGGCMQWSGAYSGWQWSLAA